MDGSTWGVVGAIVGALGGIFGTAMSIINTESREERRFVVRCAAIGWVVITTFLILLRFVPSPYKPFLWAVYILAMGPTIMWLNRRQMAIRAGSLHTSGQGQNVE